VSSIEDLKTIVSSRLGFARTNNFVVMLPSFSQNILRDFIPRVAGFNESLPSKRELNILCKNVALPGKQMLTTDRRVGMEVQKVAYGYAVEDVSMTFHVLNDYGIINYLNAWRQSMIDENFHTARYKNEYQKPIMIYQLRKPIFTSDIANLGPVSISADIGGGKVYGVELLNAFPTTISTINFSNELDGLVEVTVSFSYTNWRKKDVNALEDLVSFDVNVGQIF
jgi:hypothetical protein